METQRNQIVKIICLALIFILGSYLRVKEIDSFDFWFDEAFTGIAVRADWKEMFRILMVDKVHPPVHYILLKVWTSLFGTSTKGIRSFSAFFGMLSIPLTFIFVTELYKKAIYTALAATLVVAISPFFISYSNEARAYSLILFFATLSGIFFVRAILNFPRRWSRDWAICTVFTVLCILTHYLTVILIAVYIVAYVMYWVIQKEKFFYISTWRPFLWSVFIALPVANLIFALLKWNEKLTEKGLKWISAVDIGVLGRSSYAFLFGVDRQFEGVPPVNKLGFPLSIYTVGWLLIFLTLTTGVILINKYKNDKDELWKVTFLLIASFIPFLIVSTASGFGLNSYVERYLTIYGWYYIISIICFSVQLLKKDALVLLVSYFFLLSFVVFPVPSNHYLHLAKLVHKNNPKKVYVYDPIHFVVLKYYLPEYAGKIFVMHGKEGESYKSWAVIGESEERVNLNGSNKGDFVIIGNEVQSEKLKFISKENQFFVYEKN